MPKINEIIARVSEEKPSSMSDREMARWILELDGKLYQEFFQKKGEKPSESYDGSNNIVLLLESPYDIIYDLYLYAMIHHMAEDTEEYYNAMSLFNTKLDEFKKQYHRTHIPQSVTFKNYV